MVIFSNNDTATTTANSSNCFSLLQIYSYSFHKLCSYILASVFIFPGANSKSISEYIYLSDAPYYDYQEMFSGQILDHNYCTYKA